MEKNSSSKSVTTALITGGSSGIGIALAKEIAAHGDAIPADLRLPDAADKLYETIVNENHEIGILVNNAGFGLGGEFLETDLQREVEMIQVNVTAVTQLTKLFTAPMVRRRSGRVMNVASTAAFQPGPLMAVYYATKAYVLSFSQAVAEELRATGVTVTALCPGATATAFADTAEISNTRLFTRLGVADADDVAEYGYKAMMRGERVAIPSWRDKIMVQAERFTPRTLVTRIVRQMQENR